MKQVRLGLVISPRILSLCVSVICEKLTNMDIHFSETEMELLLKFSSICNSKSIVKVISILVYSNNYKRF